MYMNPQTNIEPSLLLVNNSEDARLIGGHLDFGNNVYMVPVDDVRKVHIISYHTVFAYFKKCDQYFNINELASTHEHDMNQIGIRDCFVDVNNIL